MVLYINEKGVPGGGCPFVLLFYVFPLYGFPFYRNQAFLLAERTSFSQRSS